MVRGVGHLAGAWAGSVSVELSDVLTSVIISSLTASFLSVYPRNEPSWLIWWELCCDSCVPFSRGNISGCGVIPVDSAGQGCSSPNHAAARLQKCSVMRQILGAVRLQILLYEGIWCSEWSGPAALLTVRAVAV